jgi:nicotinamide mononucleotide transporter
MELSQESALIIEYFSVGANLLFLLLLIRENIWCWLFGIIGSLTGALLMWASNLNSETLLYLFYAGVGVYGWIKWSRGRTLEGKMPITELALSKHIAILIVGGLMAFGLGVLMDKHTEADFPYFDSVTTVFAVFATFMETRKIFSGWYYWIVLNFASIFLYALKDLDLYTGLAVVNTVMSFVGLYQWRKNRKGQQ